MYLGQIGSGKTLELRMLMRNVIGPMEWEGALRTRVRALTFDPKGEDLWPSLRAWCPADYLVDLHAYSEDGVALHLGRSCLTLEDGEELGYALIPKTKESHPFFNPAAQQLLQGVIHTFQLLGKEWTLSDAVIACTDERMLRHVLDHHPRGKSILGSYLPSKVDASTNIVQTLVVELGPWRMASLLERRSKHYVTIDGWLDSGGVLSLRGSSRNPSTIERWNAFVFKLVISRLRDREGNYPTDETFVFVDEMPESVLADYKDALLLGRIKGVRTASTIQDPAGLVTRFGGRDQANEVLGQVGNLCVGRLASPDAAEWMSGYFGKYQYWQRRWMEPGTVVGPNGPPGCDLREEFNIYPYEFQDFPKASLETGYKVVARVPILPGWRMHVPRGFIRNMLGGDVPQESSRRRRAMGRDDLAFMWAAEDLERLGLRELPSGCGPRTSLRLP